MKVFDRSVVPRYLCICDHLESDHTTFIKKFKPQSYNCSFYLANMVSSSTDEKTGSKSITMKSTGHEKSRVSVCLTAKGNGTKLKPFIVFKGARRDVSALNTEFHGRCVIASSENG